MDWTGVLLGSLDLEAEVSDYQSGPSVLIRALVLVLTTPGLVPLGIWATLALVLPHLLQFSS